MKQEPFKGLHFVTGEKGGVGKSLWSMVLLEYCRAKKISYRFYDADRTSPDVGLIYEPQKYRKIISEVAVSSPEEYKPSNQAFGLESYLEQIFFSEDEEDVFLADRLFAIACENLVIVNLPAQVEVMVTRWLTKRGVLSLAKEEKMEIYFWFVTDGSPESLDLLERSLLTYKNDLGHLVVCNSGLAKNVKENLASHRVKGAVDQYALAVVEMPLLCLSQAEMNLVKTEPIALGDAAERSQATKLTLIAKQRVKQFLGQTVEAISSTGIFVGQSQDIQAS
jgi:hypothetical protein